MKVMPSGRQTVRRLLIFRRTCTPAILFWAYSYAGPSNFGRSGQMFWHMIRPYARQRHKRVTGWIMGVRSSVGRRPSVWKWRGIRGPGTPQCERTGCKSKIG